MDVESFNYAYFPRSAGGLEVALNDATDKAVVANVPPTIQIFDPDYFDIDASIMKPEATLYICICKRVYIFLYNYAF
jgi:hypothetical protein